MITGDLNTALVPWVVQYRITDPKMYFFGAREPEKTLRDLSESVMREIIGDRTVDEVLTIGRHDIETSALRRLAKLSAEYGLGLQIQQVQLATVRPPPVVQAAFNEVNQAQQEKQTAINQAWAIYNDAVPNARGQAKGREKQAEAYAFRRVNEAKGDTEKFWLLLPSTARLRRSRGGGFISSRWKRSSPRSKGKSSWTTASKECCKRCRSGPTPTATPAASPTK